MPLMLAFCRAMSDWANPNCFAEKIERWQKDKTPEDSNLWRPQSWRITAYQWCRRASRARGRVFQEPSSLRDSSRRCRHREWWENRVREREADIYIYIYIIYREREREREGERIRERWYR
jgi:hypothetical protein